MEISGEHHETSAEKGWDFNKDLYTETKSAQLRIQRKTGLIKLANIQEHILNKLSK